MTEIESRFIELEDTFFLPGPSIKQYIVKLSPTLITISMQNNPYDDSETLTSPIQLIPIDDIYGCLCMKTNHNQIRCYLSLYLYAYKPPKGISGAFSKEGTLNRSQLILTYGKFKEFAHNFAEATRWHRAITYAIYLNRKLPLDIVMTKRDKRVLVFINPAGGPGKAQQLVMEYVVGVWSEAEFNYHMVITEYAGHAREYVKTIQLNDWSGIVLASGDGLVYEVINGLMSRNDWQEAMKLPIGHLPCGSGNAFITNIIRHSKLPLMESTEKFIVQAAIFIATHNVIPFDLITVDTCDGKRIFSFLCIEWGIIADVDCESEQYRFLGEFRFTLEALKRIITPRIYNGYIDYIPYEPTDNTGNIKEITSDTTTAQLHQHLLPLDEPIAVDSETTKWRRINGPFAHVLITAKASISREFIAASESTLADGYLTLQYIRAGNSNRMNLAKTFTKLSDGKHFDYDFVQWMHVRAFRIVPSDPNGNMMVDGEKVPYGPVQGEALPGIARCMGRNPKVDQTPPSPPPPPANK